MHWMTISAQKKKAPSLRKIGRGPQSLRESVMHFVECIDCLVVTSHDRLDDEGRKDRIPCKQLIKGLHPDKKENLWEKCPHSFHKAATAAES